MTSQKKFYPDPFTNNRVGYFQKNGTYPTMEFPSTIAILTIETCQLMKKSNSHVSLLNDHHKLPWCCTSSLFTQQDFQVNHAHLPSFIPKDVIFSKLAPALISTVFQLQSSAIHHRKGFCEAVWKKSWKPTVVYWKFPEKQRASLSCMHCKKQ